MRRFTLSMLLAASLTASVQAQTAPVEDWLKTINATERVADLYRTAPMAIDNQGNAFVTGSYTKDLEFANSYLEPTATSAFVAKYNKNGEEQWAAGLQGAATITATATDEAGNVYVAGVFADVVKVLDAEGKASQTITGMADRTDEVSAFIVKYDKDGKVLKVKTIIPETTLVDENYSNPDPSFSPKKLQVIGNRVFLAASYTEDNKVDDLVLKGKYGYKADWFYTFDVPTMGVICLSENLDDAMLVAQLAATEKFTDVGYGAEDVNFTFDGNDVYVGFVANGEDLTLTTVHGDKQIKDLYYEVTDDGVDVEHAWILASIGNAGTKTTIFHSQKAESLARYNTIDAMESYNGKVFLAGTFNEAFPFDNSVSYQGSNDAYCVSLNADLTKNWAFTSNYDETANTNAEVVTGLVFEPGAVMLGGKIEAASNGQTIEGRSYSLSEATGSKEEENDVLHETVAQNGGYTIIQSNNKDEDGATEGNYTFYYMNDIETGIQTINTDAKTADATTTIYNIGGEQVATGKAALNGLQKGIYVIKTGDKVTKVAK